MALQGSLALCLCCDAGTQSGEIEWVLEPSAGTTAPAPVRIGPSKLAAENGTADPP